MKVIMTNQRVYPYYKFGGAEKYVFLLSKYLVEEGINVEIVTSLTNGKRKEIYEGIEYTYLPPKIYGRRISLSGPWQHSFNLNLALYLNKAKYKFDLLHSYSMTSYIYLRLKNRNPTLVQQFGNEPYKRIFLEKNILKKLYIYLIHQKSYKYCMLHAEGVIAEGHIQAEEISDIYKIPKDRIFNIPDGVELNKINDYICGSNLTRQELNIQDADVILINANRLAPNKGVSYLIGALKILNNHVNAKLILIGSGPEELRIKEQIKNLKLEDKVLHFKDISDKEMFQLYSLADISITPTLYEGLPLVVLEAMAAGKPIVASNISDIPNVIDGNGILVPPGNSEKIAEAVLEIYKKCLVRQMSIRSKELIKEYDWINIAKSTIKIYEEIINEKTSDSR